MMKLALPVRRFLPFSALRAAVWPWQIAFRAKAPAQPVTFSPLPDDIEDILSESPPPLLRNIHYIVVALFLSLILIASVVRVDIIVAARGRLSADAPSIVVQPLELSIIRDIRVKVGDTVSKGDVLATLDPTFTQADQSRLSGQRDALRAQIRRLEAELAGTQFVAQNDGPDEQLQQTLYQQRQSQYKSRLSAFGEDLQRYAEAIRVTEQNRASLLQQVGLAKEVEAMRGKLLQDQWGSKLNFLEAQSARLHAERDYDDINNHLTELQHTLRSTEAEQQIFVDEWHRQLLEELAKARTDAAAVGGSLTKADRMNDLVVLTAPEDGIVTEVAKRSVGSVLHEAEPLVTLVPTDAPLIAEVMIGSGDVGYTKTGDDVAIKVDAFPYQRHGLLQGHLRSVAEESVSPGTGGSVSPSSEGSGVFHRSQVTLTSDTLRMMPDGARLIPGMTVTAEVKVGSRSVISYFLYPIRRGFGESIREP